MEKAKLSRSIRFDPEFAFGMRERADASGIPLSEYMRNAIRFAESKGFKGVLE